MTDQVTRRLRMPVEFSEAVEAAAKEKKLDFSSFTRRALQWYLAEINRPYTGETQLKRGGYRARKPKGDTNAHS